MKGIIESHGGTVEKFIGDAVMAVFGVPVLHEDDALRATRAGSEMQAALPELGIRARIGINSGEVVTGTAERLATGDAVNVAARLEQAAPAGEIYIGEETYRLVRDAVQVEATQPLSLKGKSEPVVAYRLLTITEARDRDHTRAPMVGRERELNRLRDAFAQAVDDRSCQLFTILGSAGVGKSRLSMEFLQRLADARIVRGRCLSYGEGITYFPVVEILTQLDALPSDPFAAATARSVLGETSLTTSPDEIAWAFRMLLEEQAQEQPLVVVFDDAHWGEDTFLDLIEHVAELSREAPILVLCMARPELLEKRPGWGGGKWNATTVLLEPLDAREADTLLDALGSEVPDTMRERIREAAEGNPLFIEEMAALIRESGSSDVAVPPTIQALLAARLDQLVPDERQVLEVGSVEGRVFHRSAVQALSEEGSDLRSRLLGLVRKELVRPQRAQVQGDEAYRFRHLLIRDAAYEALPKAIRADLHERFARWLEERGADLTELDEIVGYHLEQAARYRQELGQASAGLAESAGERLAAAGRRALWRGDVRAARGLLGRALGLLRPLRWDVYLELDLLEGQGLHLADLAAGLDAIADRARDAGDGRGELVARLLADIWKMAAGNPWDLDRWEARAHTAVPLLEDAGDHDGLVRVWPLLGLAANGRSRYEQWAQAAEQAILHARLLGRPGQFGLASALAYGPRPAHEALQTLDRYLEDDPHPRPRVIRGWLLAMLSRSDEAWEIALSAAEHLRTLSSQDAAAALAFTSEIAALTGDYERAARDLHHYNEAAEARGELADLSTYLAKRGRFLCMLGRYDEAEPLAQRGRELGAEDDVMTQALWRQVQGLVLAHRGEYTEAESLAREAVAFTDRTDALNWQAEALCDLAEVLEAAGRHEESVATFQEAIAHYARKQNLAMVAQVRQRLGMGSHSVPLA